MLDMTLTVLVIALVSAVGLPRLSHAHSEILARRWAYQLASDLAVVRDQCRAQCRPLEVTFNATQNRYACSDASIDRQIPDSVRWSISFDGADSIRFDAEGAPEAPVSGGRIQIGNETPWRLDIQPGHGKIDVSHSANDSANYTPKRKRPVETIGRETIGCWGNLV